MECVAAQRNRAPSASVRVSPIPTLGGIDRARSGDDGPIPADGATLGEVMFRGNIVMKGYLKNRRGHPAKPSRAAGFTRVISACCTRTDISSSRTARRTSSSRAARTSPPSRWKTCCTGIPAVMFAAVVAKPDEKWGESPLRLCREEARPSIRVNESRPVAYCREHLAHFKCPASDSSASCRRRRRARSRNSVCASRRRHSPTLPRSKDENATR